MIYLGRRDILMSENKKVGKKGLAAIIVGGVVVLLAAIYLFLCYWGGNHVMPNHSIGDVDLSGLESSQIAPLLQPLGKEMAQKNFF